MGQLHIRANILTSCFATNTEKRAVESRFFSRAVLLRKWWSLRFLLLTYLKVKQSSQSIRYYLSHFITWGYLLWFKSRNNLKEVCWHSNLGRDEKCQYSFLSRKYDTWDSLERNEGLDIFNKQIAQPPPTHTPFSTTKTFWNHDSSLRKGGITDYLEVFLSELDSRVIRVKWSNCLAPFCSIPLPLRPCLPFLLHHKPLMWRHSCTRI